MNSQQLAKEQETAKRKSNTRAGTGNGTTGAGANASITGSDATGATGISAAARARMAMGKENTFDETYAASTVQFKLGSDDGSADEEGEGVGGGTYGWPTSAETRRLATPQIYGKDIPQFIFDFGRGEAARTWLRVPPPTQAPILTGPCSHRCQHSHSVLTPVLE